MPNGDVQGGYSLDEASQAFWSLERALSRRTARTTRSREDVNTIRALIEAWFRTYRPLVAETLGEFPAIELVDRHLRELLARASSRMVISDLRAALRAVARTIDREIVPAYDAARWTNAAAPSASAVRGTLTERLQRLSPDLAASYRQVHADLADTTRDTFLGPAGEIREVMRAAIHLLAPDEDVQAQEWYVGYEGRPTQAERIRYIVQQRSEGEASPVEAAEIVDTKVGRLGRVLYSRASRAFHVGTQRDELNRITTYVEAVLNEILPA
jgi:Predicted pPIWI-associating nuclease